MKLPAAIRYFPVLWRKPCYWLGHKWALLLVEGGKSHYVCERRDCTLGMTETPPDSLAKESSLTDSEIFEGLLALGVILDRNTHGTW